MRKHLLSLTALFLLLFAGTANAQTPTEDELYVSASGWATWPSAPSVNAKAASEAGQSWNFDDSSLGDWTNIDADGDGYIWVLASASSGVYHKTTVDVTGQGHNDSYDFVISGSYTNAASSALTPDNYFVSPQVTISEENSYFTFWACAQDVNYPAEHFGVAVSTASNTDANDFEMLDEWTMTAKNGAKAMKTRKSTERGGRNRAGAWYEYGVDLSSYAGQDVYVAIRHFNCTDQFLLNVDDIAFTGTPDFLVGYNLYLDDELVAQGVTETNYLMPTEGFEDGSEHLAMVEAVYMSGNTIEMEQEWVYASSDHFTPAPNNPTVVIEGSEANISWEIPSAGIVASDFYYDFADGTMGEFTIIDANGDGTTWEAKEGYVNIDYSDANDDYLILPKMTLTEGSVFSFASQASSYFPETFEVLVSTTGTEIADFDNTIATETFSGYQEFEYDLSNYAEESVYIAIHNISEDQYYQSASYFTVTNALLESSHIGAVVYRDDEVIAKLVNGETSYTDILLRADETPEYCISIIQNGSKEEGVYFALAEKQCAEDVVVVCMKPTDVQVDVAGVNATVTWNGDAEEYNLRYKVYDGSDVATVTLTAGNVWSDGSGYQMLLDADATAYGTIIPETGALTTGGDVPASTYAEFEYKIPENADGALTTSNIVISNSITIEIPAGTYDWCITNPTPDDCMWIASSGGNIGGRYDDYEFEGGKSYEFVVALDADEEFDEVNVTITDTRTRDDADWTVVTGITENTYTIEGLAEETQYIVEVQAVCGPDDMSDWSKGAKFTTGLDGVNENDANVSIYPNPTDGNINIAANGMTRVTVMNALGQVVYDNEAHESTIINMSVYGAGVYMVNITTDGGNIVRRVSVAK